MREAPSKRTRIIPALAAVLLAALCAGLHPPAAQSGVRAHAAQSKREVRRLQHALGVPTDGVFGPQTQRAVRRYQRRHGLTADGIVGPMTRQALGLGAGAVLKRRHHGGRHRVSRRSHRGGGVRSLQRVLGLRADGIFGPGTELAVKRFQRRHGLFADGVVGPVTRSALGLGPGRVLKRRGEWGGDGSGGSRGDTLTRVIAAANRIAGTPYKFGGGHGRWRDSGYDCSGSISYALHGGGLLDTTLDSTGFMTWGEPGRGRHITIYANAAHAYMVIDGRRYDTSAIGETGSRWTYKHRSPRGYAVRHPRGF